MAGTQHIWYATYGSNLNEDRLMCYIKGGAPTPNHEPHPGCRVQKIPSANSWSHIPYELYFSGVSQSWGGAPAYISPEVVNLSQTEVRLYRLEQSQFEDVFAQENGLQQGDIWLNDDLTEIIGMHPAAKYSKLIRLGDYNGEPAMTFTSPDRLEPGVPSALYLSMFVEGFRQGGWYERDIKEYLLSLPGVDEETVSAAMKM
ncbi:MAG: hypothetical protein KDC26_09645 [Armatimonadetes bacterium]|nr:hypothetical protein [Armatimonadota bacterium]